MPGGEWLNRQDPTRQFLSIYLTVMVHGALLYFFFSGLDWCGLPAGPCACVSTATMHAQRMHHTHPSRGSLKMHGVARRFFFFDKAYLKHPKVIPNQVYREILTAAGSIPVMSFLTAIVFWYEVRGYSKLYDGFQRGVAFEFFSIGAFLVFTDFCIYWIHRALHWPIFYGPIHKQHHLWKVPTPWASHAFHPLDGFAQSTPYHIYAFLFPMNKLVYLGMFVFVNMWTISIHDGNFISKDGVINSAAHHAEHHLHFTCNYGQYFTWWDRIFGTHREPDFEALDPGKVSYQLCRE